jgi:hypothetical protein
LSRNGYTVPIEFQRQIKVALIKPLRESAWHGYHLRTCSSIAKGARRWRTAKNVTESASGRPPEPGQQARQTQQSGAPNETLQGSPQQRAQGQRQQDDQVPVQGQGAAMQSRRQAGLARYSRDPLSNLQQIADEIDQLFRHILLWDTGVAPTAGTAAVPNARIVGAGCRAAGKQLRIHIDLPGVPAHHDSFYRAIPLPDSADVEHARHR